MDPSVVLVMRMVERLSVVVIGGVSIYLGYRLFARIPTSRKVSEAAGESSARFEGFNSKLVLSRVGPGIFFAVFGTAAVALSFFKPITLDVPPKAAAAPDETNAARASAAAGPGASTHFVGAGQDSAQLEKDRRRRLADLRVLGEVPGLLAADLDAARRNEIKQVLNDVRIGIMLELWGDDWGGPDAQGAFRTWASTGMAGDSSKFEKAAVYYRSAQPLEEGRR